MKNFEKFKNSEEFKFFEKFKKCMMESFWIFQKNNFPKYLHFSKNLNFFEFFKIFENFKKVDYLWALSWQNATTSEVIFVIESLLQWLHLRSAMGPSSTFFFEIWNFFEKIKNSEGFKNFENFKKCMAESFLMFQKI